MSNDNGNSNPATLALPRTSSSQALMVLGAMIFGGLVIVVIFGCGAATWGAARSSIATGILVSAAAGVLGALSGFLFGIPRSLQGSDSKPAAAAAGDGQSRSEAAAYGANTNLEQISDWLTKILVGVGLTQLGEASTKLKEAATALAPALGQGAPALMLASAIIVYFLVCGFLFAYLWTRLFLAAALRGADLDAIGRKLDALENQSTRDARALEVVHAFLESVSEQSPQSTAQMASAVKAASPAVRAALFIKAQQQRTQNWKLPADKPKMERTIPVFQAIMQVEDRNYENYAQLGYALKDQIQPDWAEAEKALSKAIHLRGHKVGNDWVYYEFNRALCRINLDPNYKAKQPGSEEVQRSIKADLKAALSSEHLRGILLVDSDVIAWAAINGVDLQTL